MASSLLALFAVVSCQKGNELEIVGGGSVEVSFALSAPSISTKAFADGMTVNTVHVYAYSKQSDGTLKFIEPAAEGENETPTKVLTMEGGKATYNARLVKGQTYSFVFWADYCTEGFTSPYTYDSVNQTITVDYGTIVGNDERRDAFYNVLKDVQIESATKASVSLYRPFAQLNIGASDYEEAKALGVEVLASGVKVSNVANKINLLTGEVAGNVEVSVPETALPEGNITVEGKNYKYIAMDYVLVGKDEQTLSNVELSLPAATNIAPIAVPNVPLKANYRTNILGNLLTGVVDVDIEVVPAFTDDENVYIEWNINSVEDANAALNTADVLIFDNDIDLSSMTATLDNGRCGISKPTKFVLNSNVSLRAWQFENHSTLTIEGNGVVNVPKGVVDNYGELIVNGGTYNTSLNTSGSAFYNSEGTMTLNDVTVNAHFFAVYAKAGDVTINGGKVSSDSNNKVGNWAYTVCVTNGANLDIKDAEIYGVQGCIAGNNAGNITLTNVHAEARNVVGDTSNRAYNAVYSSGSTVATINSGTYLSDNPNRCVNVGDANDSENGTLAPIGQLIIKGGVFSHEQAGDFLADGLTFVADGDNFKVVAE